MKNADVHKRLCQPKALYVPAINLQGTPVQDMPVSNRFVSRILRKANNIKQKSLKNFTIFVCNGNALFSKLIMTGPKDTYYYGYKWLLPIEFSQDYPFRPPNIRFVASIYHCNISDDEIICHAILRSHWTHQKTIYDVLKQITGLLFEPDPNDAISTVKGNLYNTAREDYYKELKEFNKKYAKATIEQLKKQYQLKQSDIQFLYE